METVEDDFVSSEIRNDEGFVLVLLHYLDKNPMPVRSPMSPMTHFSGSGQEKQFSAAYLKNVPGVKCKVGHGTGGERSVIAQHSHHHVHNVHDVHAI